MKQTPSRNRIAVVWIMLAALGCYLSFLSKAYVFEGLIRALPIESGRWGYLYPGNYLLYGPLGLVFHTLLHAAGLHQAAVNSLQIMDALLGAGGLAIFYLILRRLGGGVLAATSWTAVLGFSLGYWMWSTEAEDYILSTVLLTTNFYFLVKVAEGDPVDPLFLGVLEGLAILGHIVNVVFVPVALWFLIRLNRGKAGKPVLRYAAGAAAVAVPTYLAVLFFIQKPATLRDALIWFEGSGGAGRGAINWGGGLTIAKLADWLQMTAHLFGSFRPPYSAPAAWAVSTNLLTAAWALLSVFGIALVVRTRDIYRRHPLVVGGCAIWLAAYACVFTRWQPFTMVYRVSDLVPLCLLLFLVSESLARRFPAARVAAVALAFSLAVGNLGAEIRPRSFRSNNPRLQVMAFLKANTMEGDWIAGGGGQDEIYIPYFAERRPIVIDRFVKDPERLARLLHELRSRGQRVYVTSPTLQQDIWKKFFAKYSLVLEGQDPSGLVLYRVK